LRKKIPINRSLEVLLGRYPAAALEGRKDLPRLDQLVPSGLPSELLLRRPDLAAASARVRASAARAGAARKDLLPSIVLTGRGSTASDELADLIADPRAMVWNVAASISQPLYRGGALRVRARQSSAQHEMAVQSFAETALRAFQEVESALNADHSLGAQEKFLETELAQANLAEAQASRDYSEGIVGILAVLEAQRRAFNARSTMISLRNARLQNRSDLHLALGGDFTEPRQTAQGPDDGRSVAAPTGRPAGRSLAHSVPP
jgi:outer membrane protein, multidrug efflux system